MADAGDVARYYDDILASDEMQEVPVKPEVPALAHIRPSCSAPQGDSMLVPDATPPRRLLEVAKGFRTQSVIGSICSDDYGTTTGRLIRAIGERLNEATTAD